MSKRSLVKSSEGSKRRAWLLKELSLHSVAGSPERRLVLQFVRALKLKGVLSDHIINVIQLYQQIAQFSTLMSYDLCVENGGARIWQGCRRNFPFNFYQAAIEPSVPYNWSSEVVLSMSSKKTCNDLYIGVINLPESRSEAASAFDGKPFPSSMNPKELSICSVGCTDTVTVTVSPIRHRISVRVVRSDGVTTEYTFDHVFKPFAAYNLFARLVSLGEAMEIKGFTMHPPNASRLITRPGFVAASLLALVCLSYLTWGIVSRQQQQTMKCIPSTLIEAG